MIDDKMLHSEALPHQPFHVFCILQAIAVTDKDLGIVEALHLLPHPVHQSGERFLSSTHLADGYEMALIVHMENGFDIDHGAQNGRGLGYAAAPVKVKQIVHGKVMAELQLVLFHPGSHLLQRFSGFF